jgi:hypothetical protein
MKTIFLNSFIIIFIISFITFFGVIDHQRRIKDAVEYINTHSDSTDESLNKAIEQASIIYQVDKDTLLYSFYL